MSEKGQNEVESDHKVKLRQDEKAVNIDLNHLLESFGNYFFLIITSKHSNFK